MRSKSLWTDTAAITHHQMKLFCDCILEYRPNLLQMFAVRVVEMLAQI